MQHGTMDCAAPSLVSAKAERDLVLAVFDEQTVVDALGPICQCNKQH